jgi:hypothetical protein
MIPTPISVEAFSQQIDALEASIPYYTFLLSFPNTGVSEPIPARIFHCFQTTEIVETSIVWRRFGST